MSVRGELKEMVTDFLQEVAVWLGAIAIVVVCAVAGNAVGGDTGLLVGLVVGVAIVIAITAYVVLSTAKEVGTDVVRWLRRRRG